MNATDYLTPDDWDKIGLRIETSIERVLQRYGIRPLSAFDKAVHGPVTVTAPIPPAADTRCISVHPNRKDMRCIKTIHSTGLHVSEDGTNSWNL